MHPLKVDQPYPMNHWWVAAYSDEVSRDILGRTLLGQRVILYRTEAGEAVALSGVCPHRSYPLDKGRLVGDAVECGYHGFTFDKGGACIKVPNQAGVPTNSAIRRYPIVERGELIWIWPGDAEAADPELIPDIEAIGLGVDDWKREPTPMVTIPGRYTLLIDNLMDLGHASFIHADTIPGGDQVAMLPVEIVETAKSINVQRVGRDMPGNPFMALRFPGHDGNFDQHFDAEYYGPGLIRTGGEVYATGNPEPLGTQNFIHLITPETPTSVHYWVVHSRNHGQDNQALSDLLPAMGGLIQPQDIDAISRVEQVLQSHDGPVREVSARVDTGALKIRHRLEAQIRSEIAARTQAQAAVRESVAAG